MRKLVLSGVLLVVACGTTGSYTKLSDVDRPATTPEKIEVISTTPERPYQEIALLDAMAPQAYGLPEAIEELKKQAAQLGADAIINIKSETAPYQAGDYQMTGTRATGTAIIWTD